MSALTPTAKLSKKEKEEAAKARRQVWGINPVTRKPQRPDAYCRHKTKQWKQALKKQEE